MDMKISNNLHDPLARSGTTRISHEEWLLRIYKAQLEVSTRMFFSAMKTLNELNEVQNEKGRETTVSSDKNLNGIEED